MYYVIRNNKNFGPYDLPTLVRMVEYGRVLKCDKAADADGQYVGKTIGDILSDNNVKKINIRSQESIIEQIRKIGKDIIFPRQGFRSDVWKSDINLIIMAGVGLLPVVLGSLPLGNYLTFYAISLYFSVIWGLFFYYIFKTRQVTIRTTLTIFFLTQIFVFVLWEFTGLIRLNPFYSFENSQSLIGQVLFFFGGVGLSEELVKAAPLLVLIARAREPLVPQTMVYYGLMSGIAFGVYEGVQYQLGVNSQMDYTSSFLWNIARLTSLPFIHALWAGTAGYFISFALLYPTYFKSLIALAIGVPALLHATYDIACNYALIGFFRIPLMFFSVILLTTYLRRGRDLQERLRNLM